MENANRLMTRALYVRKSILWIFLFATVAVFSSCSVPYADKSASVASSGLCECEDGSGRTGPKGQVCGEVVEEEIGRQGYYGELQKTKRTAYFAANCRK